MKAFLLATALTLSMGTAAVAQDASPASQQPSNGQTPTDTSGAPASSMGDSGTPNSSAAPTSPDASGGSMGGQPMPADGSGMAASPSSGPTGSGMPADGSMAAPADASATPMAATGDYPACSKSVTDKCVEKGGMKKMKKRR